MEYESLISDYTTIMNSVIWMTLVSTITLIIIMIAVKIAKSRKLKRQREEDDRKLKMYFEEYSEIIANKVVEKMKENRNI